MVDEIKKSEEAEELRAKAKEISVLISGMKYCQWARIAHAIEKKFSSKVGKIKIEDPEEILRAIELELF